MASKQKKKQTGSAGGTPESKWTHEDRMAFISDSTDNDEWVLYIYICLFWAII